jgi:hypothetical protein
MYLILTLTCGEIPFNTDLEILTASNAVTHHEITPLERARPIINDFRVDCGWNILLTAIEIDRLLCGRIIIFTTSEAPILGVGE